MDFSKLTPEYLEYLDEKRAKLELENKQKENYLIFHPKCQVQLNHEEPCNGFSVDTLEVKVKDGQTFKSTVCSHHESRLMVLHTWQIIKLIEGEHIKGEWI